ncbi:MAG: diacylglycerol O-acyltransferase / wax synthase, partial [Pseudomonadota bacterium]|nr:diacylglycerol O-acyltransferase / wax synthase [Pseudomonadota bacterium]
MENRVPGVMQLVDGMKMIWDIGAGNREGVSGVDTAWLRMDRRTNLMMIVGVLMFEERMDYERLRAVLEERFLHYERFRQRVVKIGASHYWENDPLFSLQNHLQVLDLPGDAGKVELENLVSDLTSTPLDQSRPLWHFHLVENYNGGSALVARIHHCYADGISLIRV